MLLRDKVVFVTGAGSGIGRAAAILFAQEGARVGVLDCDADSAAATVEAIAQTGGAAMALVADVTDDAAIEGVIGALVDRYGALHGAFNNAGIEMANRLLPDLTAEEWGRMMAINLTGVFSCMKYATKAMAPGGGAIVNNSSGDGIIGAPYAADYVAAKHGVIGLTRAAACEARHTGVRVNALLPGLILTPMVEERLIGNPAFEKQMAPMVERHSIGRFGKPDDVAEAACWLLSDRSAFINGALLTVDGGYTAR
ncbi:SDR family NAD(P)-dependent oxidoreductase [Sphingobium limneticum]|jgi:2,5-dichloro-2,5-cyclohexadiene-1,4-diol dehydrogenase 1|nr:SDR family oxidoreductase [Sphingobium limneticum]